VTPLNVKSSKSSEKKASSESTLPIVIFTDGACSGNPGPGGWGAVIATPDGNILELGQGYPDTTNNQMELAGAIEALKKIAQVPGEVHLYTDSTYVIRGITQWIWAWRSRGWKTAEGKDVSNQPLWEQLSRIVAARDPKPEWKYVRGHQGVPGNERVDQIAVAFTKGLWIDLYRGPLIQYPVAIYDLPDDSGLPEMRPKVENKSAYSYLSLVNGVAMRHSTWKECEARVKGRSGAKFKKAAAQSDESGILKEWGVSVQDVKES
jgi:ribonuclease HI